MLSSSDYIERVDIIYNDLISFHSRRKNPYSPIMDPDYSDGEEELVSHSPHGQETG